MDVKQISKLEVAFSATEAGMLSEEVAGRLTGLFVVEEIEAMSSFVIVNV